jgi:hypothetical protein
LFFGISGSGKKTVAHVVSSVFSAHSLGMHLSKYSIMPVAEFCDRFSGGSYLKGYVSFVDATTFLTYSLDKQEHYRQTIVKALRSKDDYSRQGPYEDGDATRDFLVILAGSNSEIDSILNGEPSHQSPHVHVFDFPIMEAKDCAGYFQTLARNDGFSLDSGVLQTIEELSLAAKELKTWTNGRTMKTLWGETKLQAAHSAQSIHASPYHLQDKIPRTIGPSCVRDAYHAMLNSPRTESELKAPRPKLDSVQKVRDEVFSLLRNLSWQKESDTLGIGNFLFRGPKGKDLLLMFAPPLVFC